MSNKHHVPKLLIDGRPDAYQAPIGGIVDLVNHATDYYVWDHKVGRVYRICAGILFSAVVGTLPLATNTDVLFNLDFYPYKESCLITPFVGRLMNFADTAWHRRLDESGVICLVSNYRDWKANEIRVVTKLSTGGEYIMENGTAFVYARPLMHDELDRYIA